MPLPKDVYERYINQMKDTVKNNPYLQERYQAVKTQMKWEKNVIEAAKKGARAPAPVRTPVLNNPNDMKTEMFDQMLPRLESGSFRAVMDSVADGAKAEKYLQSMASYMELLHQLQLPSREHHGLTKTMTPEDYDRLQKSTEDLLRQTTELLGEFSTVVNNRLAPKKGMEAQCVALARLQTSLTKDAGLAKKLSATKAPMPLNAAIKSTMGVRVSGETDPENTMGAAQSSRQVITVEDKEGHQKTGLFTPKKVVKESRFDHAGDTAERFAIGQLGARAGTRLDNRNSAMTTVAELLGRGDLLAHSKEMHIDSEITRDNPTGAGTFMEAIHGSDINRMLPDDNYFKMDFNDGNLDPYTDQAKKDMMDLAIVDYLCANLDRHSGNMIYHYERGSDGKMRLNGLTGIDNDSAFTNESIPVDVPFNRLGALTETVCISESMAQKLQAMDEKSLARDMAAFGLRSDELNAMTQRLRNLQDALKNGQAFQDKHLKTDAQWNGFLSDGLGYMNQKLGSHKDRQPTLITVPDAKMKQLRVDGLEKTHGDLIGRTRVSSGVFRVVDTIHNAERQDEYLEQAHGRRMKQAREVKTNPVLREGVANFHDIAKTTKDRSKGFIKECAAKTSRFRGTSPEFEKIVTTLKAIDRASEQMSKEGYTPSEKDKNMLSALNKRLQDNCKEYLQHKKAQQEKSGKEPNEYAQNRIDLVEDIQEYARTAGNRIRMAWNEELEGAQMKATREADAIGKLTGEMKPLAEFLNAVKNPDKSKVDPATAQKNLQEKLPELCRKLKEFSATAGSEPAIIGAVGVCAKQLDGVIRRFGGDEACKIKAEDRTMLDSCKPREKTAAQPAAEAQPKAVEQSVLQ